MFDTTFVSYCLSKSLNIWNSARVFQCWYFFILFQYSRLQYMFYLTMSGRHSVFFDIESKFNDTPSIFWQIGTKKWTPDIFRQITRKVTRVATGRMSNQIANASQARTNQKNFGQKCRNFWKQQDSFFKYFVFLLWIIDSKVKHSKYKNIQQFIGLKIKFSPSKQILNSSK